MQFRSSQAQERIISGGLAPLRYLNDQGQPTEEYPLNPNGSPQGIAGLCSKDGRHLAVMPHPERCTLGWQWPWAPRDLRPALTPSPWLRMFKNAAAWCSDAKWWRSVRSEWSNTWRAVTMLIASWPFYYFLLYLTWFEDYWCVLLHLKNFSSHVCWCDRCCWNLEELNLFINKSKKKLLLFIMKKYHRQ